MTKQERKIYQAKWEKKNRKKRNEYQQIWRDQNRDWVNERQRKYDAVRRVSK
jgi:hypothetical protein